MGDLVCPEPRVWYDIYLRLEAEWRRQGGKAPKPPLPPILSAWYYTFGLVKAVYWRETVKWAEEYGCLHLVDVPPEAMCSWSDMPVPPVYDWNRDPRPIPSTGQVLQATRTLRYKWLEVAGHDLGVHTRPIALTGRKKRRLVVEADEAYQPRWGTWKERCSDKGRRLAFTDLRAAVNAAIAPLAVDHIDFISRPWPSRGLPDTWTTGG